MTIEYLVDDHENEIKVAYPQANFCVFFFFSFLFIEYVPTFGYDW